MSTQHKLKPVRGIAGLTFTREELASPLLKKLTAVLRDERALLREQNDNEGLDIRATTVLRGQLACLRRILARADEVGPESRQSEPAGPESASPARSATGVQVDFDQ